jgi:DNA-binding response OmpR family regulator
MRILLVEDEVKLGGAIKRGLEQESYAVDLLHTADEGQAYAETEEYDVIVLDRMLPEGKDGLDICRELRRGGNKTPILMLTARDSVRDRVQGLTDGADDYLIKPFSFEELLARIKALHRRPQDMLATNLRFGELSIDTSQKSVAVNKKEVRLSRKEYSLLEYLAHHPGQTVSKEQIIKHVWDFDADILPNTVEVFVGSLRKKLGNSYIETIRGFGYRLRVSAR